MIRRLAGLAGLWMLAAGCDPCSGTPSCNANPDLRVEGTLVDWRTGQPIGGGDVTVTAQGVTRSTTTASDGQFAIVVPTTGFGKIYYDLAIAPPGESPFTAVVSCQLGVTLGSGCPLGFVSSRPQFPSVAEVSFRDSRDLVIMSAPVRFTRFAGVEMYGGRVKPGAVFDTITNGLGRFELFGADVFATAVGDAIGRFTVYLPPPLDSAVLDTIWVPSVLRFREPRPLMLLRVGPSTNYEYLFHRGSPSRPAIGVKVRLERVSGVRTDTANVTGTTDATGRVRLALRPLERGTLNARLLVTPPSPDAPFEVTGIVLATHDDNHIPVAGSWDVTAPPPGARRIRR